MNKNIKQIRSAVKAVKRLRRQGFTLTELLISIVIIALLAAFSIPAIDAFMNSMGSTGSATALINAALSSARAMAIKEQRYVGVRFQYYYDPDIILAGKYPLDADMYMIFIQHDPELNGTYGFGFKAIEGLKPIKLPPNVGLTDLIVVTQRNVQSPLNPSKTIQTEFIKEPPSNIDTLLIQETKNLQDMMTFSIIFSPSGKLVVRGVRVMQSSVADEVFNTMANVYFSRTSLFCQDDDDNFALGFGPEPSRCYFLIYERDKFFTALNNGRPYSNYLEPLIRAKGLTFINPYTGTLIQAE